MLLRGQGEEEFREEMCVCVCWAIWIYGLTTVQKNRRKKGVIFVVCVGLCCYVILFFEKLFVIAKLWHLNSRVDGGAVEG